MNTFLLKIVTPEGPMFEGPAEALNLRTAGGEVGILAGHADYVAPLGMGRAMVTAAGRRRTAACIGGLLRVSRGEVTVIATTFEWAEQIDAHRASRSLEDAEAVLNRPDATEAEREQARARMKRAQVRKNVSSGG